MMSNTNNIIIDEFGYERYINKCGAEIVCDECGRSIEKDEMYDDFCGEIFCEECI